MAMVEMDQLRSVVKEKWRIQLFGKVVKMMYNRNPLFSQRIEKRALQVMVKPRRPR